MLHRTAKQIMLAVGLLLLFAITADSHVVEPEILYDNNNIYKVFVTFQ